MSRIVEIVLFIFYFLSISASVLYSNDSNISNPFPEPTIVKENIPNATNDTNVTNWNLTDFQNHFKQSGMDNGMGGNAKAIMSGGNTGKVINTNNPNNFTSDAVKNNDFFRNNAAIQGGWTNADQSEVMGKSFSNSFMSIIEKSDKISCYITRDISFEWKCPSTGVVYGGDMQASGRAARLKCDKDCYEQKSCVNLNPSSSIETTNLTNISVDLKNKESFSESSLLNKNRVIDTIDFNIKDKDYRNKELNIKQNYFISIILVKDNKNKYVLNRVRRDLLDENVSLSINNTADSIIFRIDKDNDDAKAEIKNIKVKYVPHNQYICPYLQDTNNIDGSKFANICAGGNLLTLNYGGHEYKICNDGMIGADNPDGTFSTIEGCKAACKIAKKCIPNFSTITQDSLKTMREACIEGQAGCDNAHNDCKNARLRGNIVINETVFDASMHKTNTIVNGVAIEGTDRPRISLAEDLNYSQRLQEEFKDQAFLNMANSGTYNSVVATIGENTQIENAYSIYFTSGVSYGKPGTAVRTLFWKLKPKALQVNNGKTYFLYAVIDVIAGYHDYDENAQLIKKQKRILYIKKSGSDEFKPFRLSLDSGYSTVDDNNNTYISSNAMAETNFMTFSVNTWVPLSESGFAESFTQTDFSDTALPYYRFEIIHNLGNLVYTLPGLVRRKILSTEAENQYFYTGNFDGSGDGLLTFSVYTIISENRLTYQEIINRIVNKEAFKIYKLGDDYNYKKDLLGDGNSEGNDVVKIFQYGPSDKINLSTIIKPLKRDIGQKGFIFIFIQ